MRIWGGRGGEYGVRTPVEKREETEIGLRTDLWLPLLQAVFIALGATAATGAAILALAKMGRATFWLVAFVFGAASFIWTLRQAHKYDIEAYRWSEFALSDLTVAVVFTLFSGFLSWCLHRVTTLFLGTGTPAWAVVSFLLLVWTLVFFISLSSAFLQELLQRSPFQEQSLWGAAGSWLMKPENPEPGEPEEIRYVVEATIIRQLPNGAQHSRVKGDIPATEDQLRLLWRHIVSAPGVSVGERSLGGRGRVFESIPQWREARDAMMDLGILAWCDDAHHEQGWLVTDEGAAWFEQLEAQSAAPPR